MTTEQASKKLKVSRQTLWNWENGHFPFSILEAITIAKVYKVPLTEFFEKICTNNGDKR
jgi:DNA-binding XRE family transcriptional regulator